MERTLIKDLHEHKGNEVTLQGWVDNRRDHGKLIFIDLRDRSGIVQMVCLPNHEEALKVGNTLRPEWVIQVQGIVNERPEKMRNDTPTGDIEIEVTNIKVLAQAQELPFDKDTELNLDTYLDNLPLTLRTEKARAIFTVQSEIAAAYREYLRSQGFTEFQSPKLASDDAEGGAGVFSLPYFHDKKAFLATSPQLHKQIMVGIFERVFSIGNVFRAEKHSTSRHLNEYTSMDFEMGFIADYTDVANMAAGLIRHITNHLAKTCEREFTLLGASLPLAPEEFPMMKLRAAQELIKNETGEDCTNEPDLEPEHERWLCAYAREKFNSDFIFVTHYPVAKRPMYTFEDPNDPGYTGSFDLLFRGIEIISGGQRRHEYENLIQGMKDKGLNPEKFSYYLQAFKCGMPPHGGIGMGLERLTAKFLDIQNVKEATLFPRDMNRIDSLLHDSTNE